MGVTASREGIKQVQLDTFERYMKFIATKFKAEFHHGDCIGGDASAHDIVERLNVPIVIHPPTIQTYRAFRIGTVILTPKPYLDRNHDIVDAVDLLFVIPNGPERTRSGTWATYRYAQRKGKQTLVLKP